jgi:hypothetical protein
MSRINKTIGPASKTGGFLALRRSQVGKTPRARDRVSARSSIMSS